MDQIAQILDEHIGANIKAAALQSKNEIQEEKTEAPTPAPEPLDLNKIQSELYAIKNRLQQLISYFHSGSSIKKASVQNEIAFNAEEPNVIEGIFNGEKMRGPDGKEYAVPANYASKSKLVEGDGMKLTIRQDGSFLYKQIGPIPRKRIMGKLEYSSESQKWSVNVDGILYKVLTASITFYKGSVGDEVIILIPEAGSCSWGAVENIIPSQAPV